MLRCPYWLDGAECLFRYHIRSDAGFCPCVQSPSGGVTVCYANKRPLGMSESGMLLISVACSRPDEAY